jgi:murein peptide amidase A
MASWTDMNRRVAAAALVAAALGTPAVAAATTDPPTSTSTSTTTAAEPAETIAVGMSVEGRPITAVRRGDPQGRRVLIFGVIHGDEQAGLQIIALLNQLPVPPGVDLYLVASMNPDGVANNTRGNANGVDLNRNFPFNWGPIGAPGDGQYAGPEAASEPETRAAVALITAIDPDLVIWYHQDLFTIAPGQGRDGAIRARYAELTGLPMESITGGTYTGVAAQWARDALAGNAPQPGVAFIVELGPTLSAEEARVHAEAVLTIAAEDI